MKNKLHLLLALLAATSQINCVFEKEDAFKIGAGIAALGIAFVAGQHVQTWQDALELKKIEQDHTFAKQAEQERTAQFHNLERIKTMVSTLGVANYSSKQPQSLSDKEQKQLFHDMMIETGSIILFEREINQLDKEFQKLAPADALEQKELHEKLLWIKRALYCNQYAIAEKSKEFEENNKIALQNAHIRRIETEVKVAEDLAKAVIDVKKLVRTVEQQVHHMETSQSQRLAEVSHWQAQQTLEETRRTEETRALKQVVKGMEKKLSGFESIIKKALSRVENELVARRQPEPTAPPAPEQTKWLGSSDYQPPYNPDFIPESRGA